MSNPIIVYVALGKNHDNLLIDFSDFASRNLISCERILITDHPDRYSKFGKGIIRYQRNEKAIEVLSKLRKDRPHLKGIAGDYWFYTFERFLALKCLQGAIDPTAPILHLENDILSFIDRETIDEWSKSFSKVAILRWNQLANGGVLFAPNQKTLFEFCDSFQMFAMERALSDSWTIDMQILRMLLDDKLVCELPTVSGLDDTGHIQLSRDLRFHNMRIICDSLDLGTYLFGRNSIYSGETVREGYRYEHIMWPIEKTLWKLETENHENLISSRIMMKHNDESFILPFIHVNSKINLVEANNRMLKELLPPNIWVSHANFPTNGIAIPTIHKENFREKSLRKLRLRFK